MVPLAPKKPSPSLLKLPVAEPVPRKELSISELAPPPVTEPEPAPDPSPPADPK